MHSTIASNNVRPMMRVLTYVMMEVYHKNEWKNMKCSELWNNEKLGNENDVFMVAKPRVSVLKTGYKY